MFDARTNLSADVAVEVRGHFGHAVFDTMIPRSVRLSEAPSFGLPIALYRADSRGAEAYAALAAELLRRDSRDPRRRARPTRPRRPTRSRPASHGRRPSSLPRPPPRNPPRSEPVHDDPFRAAERPGPWSRVADPAARPAERRDARSRSRGSSPIPRQPRQRFDADQLEALAASIREHGVLQPILVTETLDGYQLVAGERRFRAARLAGLERIPAVIRQLADRASSRSPWSRTSSGRTSDPWRKPPRTGRWSSEFGLTHEEIARRVGRAKSTITNTLRLLDLDPRVQAALVDGRLSEGHARALGGLPDRAAGPGLGHRDRAGALGPPDRGARPSPARATPARDARRAGAPRSTRTSSASRTTSGASSARR